MYDVLISHEAKKYYKRQDSVTKSRLNRCIELIRQNPFSAPHVKKLRAKLKGSFRYAVGGLRIVYHIDKAKQIITIASIRSRGDVYK